MSKIVDISEARTDSTIRLIAATLAKGLLLILGTGAFMAAVISLVN